MINLAGKNILVTGANGFLGSYIRSALIYVGATPYCIDKFQNDDLNICRVDITDEKSINKYVHGMTTKFAGIVNNAGIISKGNMLTSEQFLKTMNVNVAGTYNVIQKFKHLMENNASIVNISSIYGVLSPDFRIYGKDKLSYNSSAYGASKAAVAQLTKYCAVQLAPIRVNSVSPGGIHQGQAKEFVDKYSDRVPLKRMAEPEEITNVILFLLSSLSSYITGANLIVDGGLSAW